MKVSTFTERIRSELGVRLTYGATIEDGNINIRVNRAESLEEAVEEAIRRLRKAADLAEQEFKRLGASI